MICFSSTYFDAIIHFIAADNPVRAMSFVKSVRDRLRLLLAQNPAAGVLFRTVRRVTIQNYVILYDVEASSRTIIAHMIAHGARDWRTLAEERLLK